MPKRLSRRNAAKAKKRRFLKGITDQRGSPSAVVRWTGNRPGPQSPAGPRNTRARPTPFERSSGPAIHFSTSVKRPVSKALDQLQVLCADLAPHLVGLEFELDLLA